MSVLTAIFQAIAQSILWVLPLSESAHSAIFHDFAGRNTSACSTLTGVVHIGIALGILVASLKLFIRLSKEFVFTFKDIATKNITSSSKKPARAFMYMTLLSFVPMILWVIPLGEKGLLYTVLHSMSYNGTLLDDGVFLAVTGTLVLLTSKQLSLSRNNKNVTILPAIVVGVSSVLLVPVSGLSLVAGVFAVLMLMGVTKKLALRYTFVMSVPVLVVMGIIEICTSSISANVVQIIIALILSAVVSFFAVRVLQTIVKKNLIRYLGYYDISLGVIIMITGVFQLILR